MASKIIAGSGVSDYSHRLVTLEVTGGCDRGMMRQGRYTITIPYNSLSQRIQSIHRLGGKITKITLPPDHTQDSPIERQPLPQIATSNTLASPQKAAYIYSQTQPDHPDNNTHKQQEEKPSQQEKQAIAVLKSTEYTFKEEW